jgi:hypothetical protein
MGTDTFTAKAVASDLNNDTWTIDQDGELTNSPNGCK